MLERRKRQFGARLLGAFKAEGKSLDLLDGQWGNSSDLEKESDLLAVGDIDCICRH